jgi:hypothetical protein
MATADAEAAREFARDSHRKAEEERNMEMENQARHNVAHAQKGDRAYFEEKGKQRRAREQAKADAKREVYRKKGEARRAREQAKKLEDEISNTIAEVASTAIIPDIAGLISALVNVVDPIERSSMEQTGRFVAGLIPVVREIELTERVMEVHVHNQIKIHNDSAQDYLNIGYNTKAAHAAAFRDTDFEGDGSNGALEAFIQRENDKT